MSELRGISNSRFSALVSNLTTVEDSQFWSLHKKLFPLSQKQHELHSLLNSHVLKMLYIFCYFIAAFYKLLFTF
jgi:hypothetical protein